MTSFENLCRKTLFIDGEVYNLHKEAKKLCKLRINFYIKDKILFIRPIGYMDQETVNGLRGKLIEIIEENHIKDIIFNMKELSFMDSTGIGIIIGRYNQIKMKGGKIVMCELNEITNKLYYLTGLSRIISLAETEKDAYNFLKDNGE